MVRAAGMPLTDGSLAPGMLTVRVVEGAFTRNLDGHIVALEVSGGRIETARTGPDGRAQFAHLPPGSRVRAKATVGEERLESEEFEIPTGAGVRVLLVAGSGAAGLDPIGAPPIAPLPAQASPAGTVPESTSADTAVAVIRAVLATASVMAFGGLFLFRRRRT